MTMVRFHNYKVDSISSGDIYKVQFHLSGVHPSLANALRRTLLSGIPIVGFDDNYEEHNIDIRKNVSALHNEFVAHRLSLLPICMYRNTSLKITVSHDGNDFVYRFANKETVPNFLLRVKNDAETRLALGANPDNTIDITSAHIKIENAEDYNPVEEFMISDYITGDYCLIHRLKPISSNEEVQEAEELDITMIPTIGTAKIHARYCPVGTVSYEFQKDTLDAQSRNFEDYMETLQRQRAYDKLAPFNENDIAIFKGSFDVMGSERVYRRNQFGEPDTVMFCVESVGNLEAHQLVLDAINMIRLRTVALLNFFHWEKSKYVTDEKKIAVSKNKESGYIEIRISGEDHTLGNLIASYLKKLFVTDRKLGDHLTFATYRAPHPLKDEIVVVIGIKSDMNTLFTQNGLRPTSRQEDAAIQCLIMACKEYMGQLNKLESDWKSLTGLQATSFEIDRENSQFRSQV